MQAFSLYILKSFILKLFSATFPWWICKNWGLTRSFKWSTLL